MITTKTEPAIQRLMKDLLIWDGVWPWEPWCGNDFDKLEVFARHGWGHLSVTVAGDNHNSSQALARIAAARRALDEASASIVYVESVEEILRARRLAVSFHLEGTRCFERNLDLVDAFYKLGIRHALLAFNNANSAGGGCAEHDGGLTAYGRSLVAEMERVGMLLDLSHTGRRTSLEAIEVAKKPVVFSHSNADAVEPHWRNLTDDQIRACAATGGLVGISGSSGYLGDPKAGTPAVFRHLDYIVTLIGPQHVGFGFDVVFDAQPLNEWVRRRPHEWPGTDSPDWPGYSYVQPWQIHELLEEMVKAGYSEKDIRNICGGNYLRICSEVWK
jgi:membrane dipeptidase